MSTLALFDFDNTLYKKDSLLEFTKFYKGKYAFYIGMINILPELILFKLGIITNEKTKKKFISHFYKNEEYTFFLAKGKEFALTQISKNLDILIYNKLKKHISENHSIYIVTASFYEWIEPWCNEHNIKIIATKLEVIDTQITGDLSTKNCFGKEKVKRINEIINIIDFDKVYVYGSGKGDYDMLKLKK
jgi:HAD superfamily hydrolase (TIGR01490 family)